MNHSENGTVPIKLKSISLPFWTCFFIDSEISVNGTSTFYTTDPHKVFVCSPIGEFYAGSSEEARASGHALCITIVVFIALVGLVGIVTNALNILIIPRSMKKLTGSLSALLVTMSFFELITAMFAIAFSVNVILIMENVDRSAGAFYMLQVTYAIYTFGRVAFIYTTILVSIERFIVVTYPAKVESLLSPSKRRLYFITVVIIALLTDLPLIVNATVRKNIEAPESLSDFPYLYRYTEFGRYLYPWFTYYGQLLIKTWIPVPLLLVFNGLLYRSIKRWMVRRDSLTIGQRREINAATMLTTAVLLVMFWNLPYYLAFITELLVQDKHTYREVQFLKIFCITSSTTINFLMYFRNSKAFKKEVLSYLKLTEKHQEQNKDGLSVTDKSF